jgi:hypothetical protein
MELTGKLHAKFAEQSIGASGFRKREFVLVTADNPNYPQYISLQLTQDKCSLIDAFEMGTDVTVSLNIRGREWTSPQGEIKYFNTLEAWRIVPAVSQQAAAQHQPAMVQAPTAPKTDATDISSLNDADDLPF